MPGKLLRREQLCIHVWLVERGQVRRIREFHKIVEGHVQQNVTLLTLWHTAQALGTKPADLLSEEFVVGRGASEDEGESR